MEWYKFLKLQLMTKLVSAKIKKQTQSKTFLKNKCLTQFEFPTHFGPILPQPITPKQEFFKRI